MTIEEVTCRIEKEREALLRAARNAGANLSEGEIAAIVYHLDMDGFRIVKR